MSARVWRRAALLARIGRWRAKSGRYRRVARS
jgi:hypothetical protein